MNIRKSIMTSHNIVDDLITILHNMDELRRVLDVR
jgi:hypothetical protein